MKQSTTKKSVFFPPEMQAEIVAEARRQDRSISWVIQEAWRRARKQIMQFRGPREVA